jgi:hypothetical protein
VLNDVCFSNRLVGLKRFQAIHYCGAGVILAQRVAEQAGYRSKGGDRVSRSYHGITHSQLLAHLALGLVGRRPWWGEA